MKGYTALYFPDIKRFEPLSPFGDRPCVVGRSPSADIVVPDPTCAREQFALSATAGGYSDKDIQDAVDQALERVGLKDLEAMPIRHLSGGEKKRAALANETVSRPIFFSSMK